MTAITTASYTLCDTCTKAVVNDDHTALDEHAEAQLSAFLDRVGYLIPHGPADPGGYWHCPACDEITIGAGHTFHTLD